MLSTLKSYLKWSRCYRCLCWLHAKEELKEKKKQHKKHMDEGEVHMKEHANQHTKLKAEQNRLHRKSATCNADIFSCSPISDLRFPLFKSHTRKSIFQLNTIPRIIPHSSDRFIHANAYFGNRSRICDCCFSDWLAFNGRTRQTQVFLNSITKKKLVQAVLSKTYVQTCADWVIPPKSCEWTKTMCISNHDCLFMDERQTIIEKLGQCIWKG